MDEHSLPYSPHDRESAAVSQSSESPDWDDQLLAEDLEQAYLRALEASEAVEREMQALPESPADELTAADQAVISASVDLDNRVRDSAGLSQSPTTDIPSAITAVDKAAADQTAGSDAGAAGDRSSTANVAHNRTSPNPTDEAVPHVTEKQVVEAALFVGGMPLTAKKLSSLFHTDHGFGFVECLIDELNQQYAEEGRPYSIVLGEGGYRLALLSEFEPIRNKVFGYGPKDVKLAQDALEVLSLVAYKQPITKGQIEALGKSGAGPLLRQLLQRELIRIDRAHTSGGSSRKNDPPYVTTPRFLSLFGLGSLNDLPVADDINFK